jgi:hypothetical protein
MKPIDREEILPLAEYERIREPFRSRIIAEKKRRRIQIGPKATAVFENRETVLLQIQEMLRTERITRPQAVQHEIDTYNESVPGEDELSMTLMIEIVDKEEREAFLREAVGFESHIWLVVGAERIRAISVDRSATPGRTTAVHYLKFKLPSAIAASLRDPSLAKAARVSVQVDHPLYTAIAPLSPEAVRMLGEDLQP